MLSQAMLTKVRLKREGQEIKSENENEKKMNQFYTYNIKEFEVVPKKKKKIVKCFMSTKK